MVAPTLPANLAPASWQASTPDDRTDAVLPVADGEPCFAIMFYTPPKRSRWRPRTLDAIPPMHVGKRILCFPSRVLANVVADVREFNAVAMRRATPGRPMEWAVAVSMICGFDETARVVDLLDGGAT